MLYSTEEYKQTNEYKIIDFLEYMAQQYLVVDI